MLNHKPLEQIIHKILADTTARLQRMMMWLQPYDKILADTTARLQRMMMWLQPYNFQLKFRPGKEMTLPDALSRYILKQYPTYPWI